MRLSLNNNNIYQLLQSLKGKNETYFIINSDGRKYDFRTR